MSQFRRPYMRAKPTLTSRNQVLIITEGECSEPNYLRALCERLEFKSAKIEHPDSTDPLNLVDAAIRRKREIKRETGATVDHVWVVLDLERPHDERRILATQAAPIAMKAGVNLAISDPCFEFWILLHFDFTTSGMESCKAAFDEVRSHEVEYTKNWPKMHSLIHKVPDAVGNARKCREYHEAHGGDRNPCTDVDKLVVQLNDLARPEFRIKLPDLADPSRKITRRHNKS